MKRKTELPQTQLEKYLTRYVAGKPVESDARDLAQLWELIQLLQPESGREEAAYVWLREQMGAAPSITVAAHLRRVTTRAAPQDMDDGD